MTDKEKVVFSWSGGKDSAMALYELQQNEGFEVVSLLTSVAEQYKRVSHHGVREELLALQAASIDLPLDKLYLPAGSSHPCTNQEFEELMGAALDRYRQAGVMTVAHGDLFLEDLRQYRERNLARIGMRGIFPLWHRNTRELLESFIQLGFRAYLSCVDGKKLDRSFAGRAIDADFLCDLPDDVDPCGEYGEYHSFVYDGPIFRWPLSVTVGEVVLRDGRYYADLLASNTSPQDAALSVNAFPPV